MQFTLRTILKFKIAYISDPFIQAMIVTSWRSGSTFTGELLNSVSGSFYSYEPLSLVGITRIYNNSQNIQLATNVIKGIFQCNYSMVHRECMYVCTF